MLFLLSADLFKNRLFKKNLLRMTSVSNSLDPDHAQHFVRPDIGANYLLKLSVDDTCRYRVK